MIKEIVKILALFILMYYWFIFEMSYLPFFTCVSFIALFVVLINLLEEPKGRTGTIAALFLGLLMDIYSAHYIGLLALSFFFASLLLKYILFRYVRIPSISWIPKI